MRQTQKQEILRAFKNGRRLTPIDALNEFGCFRLAAVVFDLKQEGHEIATGKKRGLYSRKYFAEYYLPTNGQKSFI